jgi:hypothetical protein
LGEGGRRAGGRDVCSGSFGKVGRIARYLDIHPLGALTMNKEELESRSILECLKMKIISDEPSPFFGPQEAPNVGLQAPILKQSVFPWQTSSPLMTPVAVKALAPPTPFFRSTEKGHNAYLLASPLFTLDSPGFTAECLKKAKYENQSFETFMIPPPITRRSSLGKISRSFSGSTPIVKKRKVLGKSKSAPSSPSTEGSTAIEYEPDPESLVQGSGSSCHQCKSRREYSALNFCCRMFCRKGEKDKKVYQS